MVPQYQEYCKKIIKKLFLLTLAFVGGWLNTESKISCLCQDSNPRSSSL